jgi:O-antigen biosynthesis protein
VKTVNIVVLTFNKIKDTKKCINSIYSFTTNFNLLIFDNGSNPDLINYLDSERHKHDNLYVHYNKQNDGVIVGRNRGYAIINNIYPGVFYTAFLDDDQIVKEGWMDSYLSYMERGFDVVGTEAWKMRRDFYPYKKISDPFDYFNYVGCGGMVVKNRVVEDIGLFDDRFSPMYFEDPDFCFRAHERGYKIAWNYNLVVHHQKHDLALRGNRRKYFMNSWQKFQEKWKNYNMPKFSNPVYK